MGAETIAGGYQRFTDGLRDFLRRKFEEVVFVEPLARAVVVIRGPDALVVAEQHVPPGVAERRRDRCRDAVAHLGQVLVDINSHRIIIFRWLHCKMNRILLFYSEM